MSPQSTCRCSVSLIATKVQTKSTVGCHLTPVTMAVTDKSPAASVGEPLCPAGGTANRAAARATSQRPSHPTVGRLHQLEKRRALLCASKAPCDPRLHGSRPGRQQVAHTWGGRGSAVRKNKTHPSATTRTGLERILQRAISRTEEAVRPAISQTRGP